MRTISISLLIAAMSLAQVSLSAGQSFEMTADKFREAFSKRLKEDGRDVVSSCQRWTHQISCHYRNDPIQDPAGRSRRIDFDELLTLGLADGKLVQITLAGQRISPSAQTRFIGQVSSALAVLDPTANADMTAAIVSKLGLSRGDDAPNIGEGITVSTRFGEIDCLNQYSKVSTVISCTIDPVAH